MHERADKSVQGVTATEVEGEPCVCVWVASGPLCHGVLGCLLPGGPPLERGESPCSEQPVRWASSAVA